MTSPTTFYIILTPDLSLQRHENIARGLRLTFFSAFPFHSLDLESGTRFSIDTKMTPARKFLPRFNDREFGQPFDFSSRWMSSIECRGFFSLPSTDRLSRLFATSKRIPSRSSWNKVSWLATRLSRSNNGY